MAIHYNQRLDHFLLFGPVMSGIVGLRFICQLKAHHYLLLLFPFSRDQVFRINVRNGDEISKLSQLVNSDNFKVPSSPSLGYQLTLVGEDSCSTGIVIPEEFLCIILY